MDKRLTPPSSVDPEASAMEVNKISKEDSMDAGYWITKAREAFSFSTTYIDANYRSKWDNSIKAFNSEHPSDSKYNTTAFEKRSRLFRPKTRSIIRKIEAAAATAYFSNSDVISMESENPSDLMDCASAEIMKELVQHHLTKTIPWYQTVTGGLQDSLTVGSACAHIYWDTKTKTTEKEITLPAISPTILPIGSPANAEQPPSINQNFNVPPTKIKKSVTKLVVDRPAVDLIPIENIRIDPAASWTDPVNTSPYIIHLIPMYVGDVKTMMTNGKWLPLSEGVIKSAVQTKSDTTHQARLKTGGDPYNTSGKTISDYEIVWVQRHIHRVDDVDYDFYTLGDIALLTDPVPLSETVFHGQRPYVMGNCIVETHKVYASGIPELSKGLQEEANEISNQRLDNVKYALNKKWIVARNKQVDLASLVRNVPGSITMADSIDDVREITTPDVTASSYQEQDRINVDMDELLGNFGAGTIQNNKQLAQSATGMAMINQSANILVEYTLRTFTETFVEPILNQLVLLEKHYETNDVLFGICGNKSKSFRKIQQLSKQQPQPQQPFNGQTNTITVSVSDLLKRTLYVRVNVGMGATSPEQRINKLITGIMAYTNIAKSGVPNLNISEVGKEIFGALGYADGSRFITMGDNPEVQQLQQQIMQLTKALQDKQAPTQAKIAIADQGNKTKFAIATMKEQHQNTRTLVDHFSSLTHKGLGGLAKVGAVKAVENTPPGQQQGPIPR